MKEYELKIFDAEGNLIRKILKDYVPVKVTQEDVDERLEGEELPPQLKERMAIPEYHCPFRWLISDNEGRVFVRTYERVIKERVTIMMSLTLRVNTLSMSH